MNDPKAHDDAFYICAGICRVNLKTNCCMGCGRPWDLSEAVAPEFASTASTPQPDAGSVETGSAQANGISSGSA